MGKLSATRRLVYDALLMALYVLFAKLTIQLQDIRITLAPLPILVASLFFLPYDACLVAGLGEFIIQLTGEYGLTPTTPLWILPPIIRALLLSLPSYFYRKRGSRIENHLAIYFLVILLSALFTTVANTGVWFLDAYLMAYPFPYTLLTTILRGIAGLITSFVIGALALPLSKALQKVFSSEQKTKPDATLKTDQKEKDSSPDQQEEEKR